MKRSKKISVLRECARNGHICRCFYEYDKSYWYYYINDFNDRFVLDRKKTTLSLTDIQSATLTNCKKQKSRMISVKR